MFECHGDVILGWLLTDGFVTKQVVGLNFSSATTPELMLKTFDHYCEYRKTPNGVVLSPIQLNKWLVLFCDEINLPDMDKYGKILVFFFCSKADIVLKKVKFLFSKDIVLYIFSSDRLCFKPTGTQRVISFLRQMVEHGGFFRTSDQTWVKFERIQFVGACNPPTDPGRKPLSHR